MNNWTANDAREVRDYANDQIQDTRGLLGVERDDRLTLADAILALYKCDTVEQAKTFLVCLKLPNALLVNDRWETAQAAWEEFRERLRRLAN